MKTGSRRKPEPYFFFFAAFFFAGILVTSVRFSIPYEKMSTPRPSLDPRGPLGDRLSGPSPRRAEARG